VAEKENKNNSMSMGKILINVKFAYLEVQFLMLSMKMPSCKITTANVISIFFSLSRHMLHDSKAAV
jgi:hypothetical protein